MKHASFQVPNCPSNPKGDNHEPVNINARPAVQPFFQPDCNVVINIALCRFCGTFYGLTVSHHDDAKAPDDDDRVVAGYGDEAKPNLESVEVLQRLDIVTFIGETVDLKRTGSDYRGPCPFHGGKHRNFAVIPKQQMFYCFVCHETGNAIDYAAKRFGVSQQSALESLRNYVGLDEADEEDSPF